MRVEDLNEYGLTPGAPTPVGQQTHATTANAAPATPVLQPGNTPAQETPPKTTDPKLGQEKKPTIAKAKELEVDFEFPDKEGNVVKVITPSSGNKNKGVVVQNQKTKEFYTLDPEDNVLLPQVEMEEDAFSNSLKRITGKRGKKLRTGRKGHRHLQLGRTMKKMRKLLRKKRLGSNPIFEITVDDPNEMEEALHQPIHCSFEAEFVWHDLPGSENYDEDIAQRAVAEEINNWIVENSLVKSIKAGDYYQGDVEPEQNYWRVEDDPSLESAAGITSEIISPMYETPATMLGEMNSLLDFLEIHGVETNNTTDLHVTMSWARDTVPVDKLKMGLLLGDRYFLQQFENEDPIKVKRVERILHVLARNPGKPNALHALEKELVKVAESDKFSTVYFRGEENELNNQLVEFRVVGGDNYHLNFGKITDLVTKYSAIMTAGHDNTKYNQEYLAAVNAAIHGIQKTEPVEEKAPPGAKAERFIKKNKEEFKNRYGDRWEEVLYATAWKQFGESTKVKEPGTFDKFNDRPLEEQLSMLNDIDDMKLEEAWAISKMPPKVAKKVKEKKAQVAAMFEGAVPDMSSVRQIKKVLAEPLLGKDLTGQMAAYIAVPDPEMIKSFRDAIAVGGKEYDLRNIFKGFIQSSVHPEIIKQLNLEKGNT